MPTFLHFFVKLFVVPDINETDSNNKNSRPIDSARPSVGLVSLYKAKMEEVDDVAHLCDDTLIIAIVCTSLRFYSYLLHIAYIGSTRKLDMPLGSMGSRTKW